MRRCIKRPIALHLGGATFFQGNTLDLSNGGASVMIEERLGERMAGSPVGLWMSGRKDLDQVSAYNGTRIPCTIVRLQDQQIAVQFDNPSYALSQLNAILLSNI